MSQTLKYTSAEEAAYYARLGKKAKAAFVLKCRQMIHMRLQQARAAKAKGISRTWDIQSALRWRESMHVALGVVV